MTSVFDRWAELNRIIAPFRVRFDGMREGIEELEKRKELTPCTFKALLRREGYEERYPLIPFDEGTTTT